MYLVFAGDNYYPLGGWDDLVGTHATYEEAAESVEMVEGPARREFKISDRHYGWYQIVNARTLKKVEEGS